MAGVKAAVLRLRLAEGRLKHAYDLAIANTVATNESNLRVFLANVRDLPSVKQLYDADYVTVEEVSAGIENFDAEHHL